MKPINNNVTIISQWQQNQKKNQKGMMSENIKGNQNLKEDLLIIIVASAILIEETGIFID